MRYEMVCYNVNIEITAFSKRWNKYETKANKKILLTQIKTNNLCRLKQHYVVFFPWNNVSKIIL